MGEVLEIKKALLNLPTANYKGKGASDVGCRKPWLSALPCYFLRGFQFSMSLARHPFNKE